MSKQPLIIGHRGASAHAPENTLAAFKMALDAGADGIEFDVQLSKDGVPVVIHDADRMNESAGNRLLKTIEEPADRLVFVLTTSRPDEVLITIRSRCQRIDFAALSDQDVANVLRVAGAGPMQYASSASFTCSDSESACE